MPWLALGQVLVARLEPWRFRSFVSCSIVERTSDRFSVPDKQHQEFRRGWTIRCSRCCCYFPYRNERRNARIIHTKLREAGGITLRVFPRRTATHVGVNECELILEAWTHVSVKELFWPEISDFHCAVTPYCTIMVTSVSRETKLPDVLGFLRGRQRRWTRNSRKLRRVRVTRYWAFWFFFLACIASVREYIHQSKRLYIDGTHDIIGLFTWIVPKEET